MTRSFSLLAELHQEGRMGAPAQITGLATTLREQLAQAIDRANTISAKAKSSVGNLHSVLDGAESTITEIDQAAADVQAALGLSTNGGPALDASAPGNAPAGSSGQPATSPEPSQATGHADAQRMLHGVPVAAPKSPAG